MSCRGRSPGRCCAPNDGASHERYRNARKVDAGAGRRLGQEIIRVERVKKRYGDVEILKGVDLTVDAGQFTAIMGKSGSGKSTLLGIIAGLEKPDEGDVSILGHSLAGMSDRDLATLRRRSIGIVFQGFSLIPSLTALDNVLLPTFFSPPRPAWPSAANAASICSTKWAWANGCTTARRRCPAANSSAWRSRAL